MYRIDTRTNLIREIGAKDNSLREASFDQATEVPVVTGSRDHEFRLQCTDIDVHIRMSI